MTLCGYRQEGPATQEVIVVISSARIGIESILPNEAWRFNERGVKTLGRLYQQLSPYRECGLSIDDFVRLACESKCFLAVDLSHNGAIVGIIRLVVEREIAGRYGVLHDTVVDATRRGQGIGKALTHRVVTTARNLQLRYINFTLKPTRVEANGMYQALGFQLVSAADPEDKESTNHYRLTL
ncbi:MAG: GNAT family N-acetyltransferase [Candidatus Moraniibacteriota bacterium]